MGFASISGRARTDVNNPRAFACCDRCSLWYNHEDLKWQYEYRGRSLQNIRILVCDICNDVPNEQLKPRIIPPDPLPILNARVEPFAYDEEDDRYTTNPALPNIDLATTFNTLLNGYQFIDGIQVTDGMLILVKDQTDATKNGIYRASSGPWKLLGFNNDTKQWFDVASSGIQYYGQLGYFEGTVNVARGITQYAKLYQITFVPFILLADGTDVTVETVNPSFVNHYDFYTGIYMEGADVRVTEDDEVRSTQETGAAPGSFNEIPGFSNLVPGAFQIGNPDQVPYGNAAWQGLPSGFTDLPYAGPLWPKLQNQSINYWSNFQALPAIWVNNNGSESSFVANGFWPNPGPGAPWIAIGVEQNSYPWVNIYSQVDSWINNSGNLTIWSYNGPQPVFGGDGSILWRNAAPSYGQNITLWNNNNATNVNWSEIYPSVLPTPTLTLISIP